MLMQFGNKSFPDCVYHEATLGEETKGPSNTIFVVRAFSLYRSTEILFQVFVSDKALPVGLLPTNTGG